MGETDTDSELGYIHYIYTNLYKCVTDDSIKVSISPLPPVSAGHDTAICASNGKYLLSNALVNPLGGSWFPVTGTPADAIVYSKNNDSVFFDPGATKADTVYGVEYYYKSSVSPGCSNSDTVFIKVVHLPNANWTMNYVGDSAYFHAQDSSLAGAAYHWDFGDGNTGTGHSPKHVYLQNKSYAISLRLGIISSCMNSFDSTVNITKSGVGILQYDNYSIQIYPNPFSSSTTIQYTLYKPSKVSIALYDVTGRQIALVTNISQYPGQYQAEINAEKYHLNPGVYFLKIMTDDGYVNRQIVKF